PEVRAVLARQMINHRGPQYAQLQAEVLDGLRHFYQTEQDVLLFSGSGTGGLEAAVVNTLSPGDRVVAVTIGAFGERFAAIAEAYGAHVHRVAVPWGHAARPEMLAAVLEETSPVRAVLITCNETSTGVMNALAELVPVARAAAPSALLLVDAISALGAVDLPMDALGLDVLISGSQKAWMAPPGITMLGVSDRAWEAHARARMPRFYWDFARQHKAQARGQDAWTPSVSTMYALQTALNMMRAEGRAAIVARHKRIAALTQQGLEARGFSLFAEPGYRSHTVTAAEVPDGIDAKALIAYVRDRHNVIIADGQERLAGKIVRIGHMGWVEEAHIVEALDALGDGLRALGAQAPLSQAI
ncbi:MAG TPA: alanine--glyoxylate aminotransferase family protein, partial [Chloroflexota bacterium]|nr:alanine--glyoxylate aminotransferase family protein [Chloroflexota bacterium]